MYPCYRLPIWRVVYNELFPSGKRFSVGWVLRVLVTADMWNELSSLHSLPKLTFVECFSYNLPRDPLGGWVMDVLKEVATC